MANTLKFGGGQWATKEGSTLAYNDENGNFKPLPFTFDRASTATRVNKQGLIETVGADQPRIDYLNDSKGALLLEPSRSNYITYSEDFSSWTQENVSTASIADSFDGSNNAYKVSISGASGFQTIRNTGLSVSGTQTFTIYAKKDTLNFIRILLGSHGNFWVDLTNGTQGSTTGTFSSINITSAGNGFFKIVATFTPTSAVTHVYIYPSIANGNVTQSSGSIILQYAQIEQGSYGTSYIPTSGSAVTRLADSCIQTPPSGVIGQTEGTIFLDSKMALQSINNYQLFSINNGGGSDRIRVLTATGNRLRFIYQLDGGTLAYSFYNPTDYGDLTSLKIAFTYKSGDIKVYINGVLVDSSTNTFTIAEKLIDIDIASSAGGFNQMSFNEVKIYDEALTDQQLQALTQV